MITRCRQIFIVVLIASGMVGTLIAAESNDDTSGINSNADDRVHDDSIQSKPVVEQTKDTAPLKKRGRSIKMIVGGQSTDGLAKEVILPVEE